VSKVTTWIGKQAHRLIYATIVFAWVLRLPRTTPGISADRGMFASYAERVLAGDKLYVDVWYPKDPIFIWILALGRYLSPTADVVIENLWLLMASYAVYKIGSQFDLSKNTSIVCGFLLTPTILVGGNYYPGYSHLPGISLTLLIIALALSNKFTYSGILISVLFFTKIMVVPVAALLLSFVVFSERSKKVLIKLILGCLIGLFAVLSILGIRGEFKGYITTVIWNFSYSSGDVYPNWIYPLAHILRASNSMSWTLIIFVILILLINRFNQSSFSNGSKHLGNNYLQKLTLISLIASLIVLGVSGMWDHHNQILYVPGVLSILLISKYMQEAINRKEILAMFCGLLMAILVGGPKNAEVFVTYPEMKQKIFDLNSIPSEAKALLEVSSSGNYARLGTNGSGVNSFGLRQWKLVCPYLEFYPKFSEAFAEFQEKTLDCLPDADYIIVSPEFQEWLSVKSSDYSAKWSDFILKLDFMLESDFRCSKKYDVLICTQVN
jgi:hypothetical protein